MHITPKHKLYGKVKLLDETGKPIQYCHSFNTVTKKAVIYVLSSRNKGMRTVHASRGKVVKLPGAKLVYKKSGKEVCGL